MSAAGSNPPPPSALIPARRPASPALDHHPGRRPGPSSGIPVPGDAGAFRAALKHPGEVVHGPHNHVMHTIVACQAGYPGEERRDPADFPDRPPRPPLPKKPEMCAAPFCAHFGVCRVLQNDHNMAESRGSTFIARLIDVRDSSPGEGRERASGTVRQAAARSAATDGLRHRLQARLKRLRYHVDLSLGGPASTNSLAPRCQRRTMPPYDLAPRPGICRSEPAEPNRTSTSVIAHASS